MAVYQCVIRQVFSRKHAAGLREAFGNSEKVLQRCGRKSGLPKRCCRLAGRNRGFRKSPAGWFDVFGSSGGVIRNGFMKSEESLLFL